MYLNSWYSIAGKDENLGKINSSNEYINDFYDGEKTFEDCEIKMIRTVVNNLVEPLKDYLIIGGNLSNQLGTFSKALVDYNYPVISVYSACASFVESLIIASILKRNSIVLTSSHLLTSERQFRYPIEYNSLKKSYSTYTITASVGAIVSNKKSKYKLGKYTIGKMIDSTISDANNMGGVMALSAANTIYDHLFLHNRKIEDYDYIVTGDLGELGLKILNQFLKEKLNMDCMNIIDAGTLVYKIDQNKGAGASGPSVLPYVLFNKLINTNFKRILLVGTGSMHNVTLVNQKNTIPTISHAIEIEVEND